MNLKNDVIFKKLHPLFDHFSFGLLNLQSVLTFSFNLFN
jgi:hypothetical protein